MTVESGKLGKIMIGASSLREIKNWKFDRSGNVKAYTTSSTSGYQKTVPGQFSGTVSFEMVVDPADPPESEINEGDSLTLLLYRNATKYYSVPIIIDSMSDDVNIEEGEPPTVSVEATTNGAWTDVPA
jgi:hypothetical protein